MAIQIRVVQIICMASLIFMDAAFYETIKIHFSHLKREGALGSDFNRITRTYTAKQLAIGSVYRLTSYAVGRTIGGYIVLVFNNKYFVLITVAVDALMCALVKTLTYQFGSVGFVVIIGFNIFCQSMHFPIALNMIAKWIPAREYSRAIAAMMIGEIWGEIIFSSGFPFTSRVNITNIFEISMALRIIWMLVYMVVGSQDPRMSWLIGSREMTMLYDDIGSRKKICCEAKTPWKMIFATPIVYGLLCVNFAFRWTSNTMNNFSRQFPSVTSTEYIFAMIFQPLLLFGCAWFADILVVKFNCTPNDVRKVWASISMWGTAASIAWLCFYIEDTRKQAIFFTMTKYFCYAIFNGWLSAAFDLSPNYAVIVCTLTGAPGWLSLILKESVQATTTETGQFSAKISPHRWAENLWTLYRTGLLLFFLNYGILMFGDIKLQNWDYYEVIDWRRASEVSHL